MSQLWGEIDDWIPDGQGDTDLLIDGTDRSVSDGLVCELEQPKISLMDADSVASGVVRA